MVFTPLSLVTNRLSIVEPELGYLGPIRCIIEYSGPSAKMAVSMQETIIVLAAVFWGCLVTNRYV